MKKVAILTLNGYFNYGNRLQNYALQEAIRGLGFEVETIINNTTHIINSKKAEKIRKYEIIKDKNVKDIYKLVNKKLINSLYGNELNKKRTQIFKDFSKQYINETEYTISINNIPKDLSNRYDYFVTGSDQVWNPNFRKGSPIDFLTFAPKEKRISYAASFGVSYIPEEYKERYRKWLFGMNRLSVREEAGAEIIKELTGRETTVVLDPTMLLTREEWLSISKEPVYKPERYLLTYFLGDIPKARIKKIKEIAKRNNLEIVNLAQISDKKYYLSGPSEFINYIESASVFCTDSFHGAVFSILLKTPFIVFNREGKGPSMNSRLETLLEKFRLEDRLEDNIQSNQQIFNCDLTNTLPILEDEKEISLKYLRSSLKSFQTV